MGQVVEFSKTKRKVKKVDLSNVTFTFSVNILKTCKNDCIEITYSETRNKWDIFVEAKDLKQMEQLKRKAIKQLVLKKIPLPPTKASKGKT